MNRSTFTSVGYVSHLPLRVWIGGKYYDFDAPVKVGHFDSHEVPKPFMEGDRFVFALPGGGEIASYSRVEKPEKAKGIL